MEFHGKTWFPLRIYGFSMKSVNAVVHVHESESESLELPWIIDGLVLHEKP